jgi:hypothetical protein
MCYICFDDTSATDNELVQSPCACKKLVHRQCLSKWITTKGSRLCSICKSKLPIDVTVEAPFVVLQVVRHMRGLHWSGEREYILSFSRRSTNTATVGSGPDCDLVLPDPSLSRTHSRIEYRDGAFQVEDLTSSAGTFLKLTVPHHLAVEHVCMFKMGRTMLTIKVERRRRLLHSWRSGRKKKADGITSPASSALGVDAEDVASMLSSPSPVAGRGGAGGAAGSPPLALPTPDVALDFSGDDMHDGGESPVRVAAPRLSRTNAAAAAAVAAMADVDESKMEDDHAVHRVASDSDGEVRFIRPVREETDTGTLSLTMAGLTVQHPPADELADVSDDE